MFLSPGGAYAPVALRIRWSGWCWHTFGWLAVGMVQRRDVLDDRADLQVPQPGAHPHQKIPTPSRTGRLA